MSNIAISFMEKRDIEKSARVLSIAMLDNPIHYAVFQSSDEKARIEIEKDFLKLLNDKPGIVFIAKEKENIIGVMRMQSCSGNNTSHVKEALKDENNIEWRKSIWLNEWASFEPQDQHWILGPIGVLPTHQGSGVGSTFMKRFCKEVDACQARAYLETDKDINVSFYEKFGFKTISESVILDVKCRYMLRASI
jgi:ribosomal protein S18 acetylase RimI-like enzyme